MNIRKAEAKDLEAINEIFNWYSANTFSTFLEEMNKFERQNWFKRFKSPKHIALVGEVEDQLIGYACSFNYRGSEVFQNTVESSIYLNPSFLLKGYGTQLYTELFKRLEGKGVHRVVVGIALPNEPSVALHKKCGFEEIGTFDEYAFYKGAYRSSLWMQKKMEG